MNVPGHTSGSLTVGYAVPAAAPCERCRALASDLDGVKADRDSLKRRVEELTKQNVDLHSKLGSRP